MYGLHARNRASRRLLIRTDRGIVHGVRQCCAGGCNKNAKVATLFNSTEFLHLQALSRDFVKYGVPFEKILKVTHLKQISFMKSAQRGAPPSVATKVNFYVEMATAPNISRSQTPQFIADLLKV